MESFNEYLWLKHGSVPNTHKRPTIADDTVATSIGATALPGGLLDPESGKLEPLLEQVLSHQRLEEYV